jgi:hypothetical protein
MADLKDEITYTEVSYAMIEDKKYKLYIGNDGKWYKREILSVVTEERNGYFRPIYTLGDYEQY